MSSEDIPIAASGTPRDTVTARLIRDEWLDGRVVAEIRATRGYAGSVFTIADRAQVQSLITDLVILLTRWPHE